jgi:uncharacterized repeat protein (TIGR02543 family)
MLKDYYGGARLNNDIGAYASAYLGGSADANYYTVAYAKGTKDAVTDMPGTLDAGTVAENGNQTVSAAVPKRAGYTFIGWEADDNNKTTYQPKSSIENITRDIVLTALWEVTPTLTYHPNGGAGESKSYPVPSGSKYTLYNADVVAFSRSGFYFTGWNAEPDGEGASYAPGAEITMPKDGIILYAQWGAEPVDPETYTVTYDASGGEGGNTVSGIEAGSIHTLLSITEAKVSRAGYTFIGWNAEPDGEGASYAPGDLFTMPGTDTTFYARWEIDASKPSGGGGGGGSVVILPPKTPEGTAIFSDEHYAYITGYPDGTVRPGADISRAELATIIFRLLSDETRNRYYSKTNGFSDVEQGEQWANTAISTVSGMGVVKGYPDGTFAPEKPMTRAEFATMLARFYDSGQDSAATHPFSDVSEHWAEREIARAYALGLISGYPDGTFRPDANITRAEAVTLINRITDRCVLDDPADMLDGMIVWPDNMNIGAWYYYAVQEASNSHEYVHGEDNHYWTKLIPNRDWLTLER